MGEKIAVFGGTFNPPHLGHMQAAREAIAQISPDRLLIMPTAIPPHKEFAQEVSAQMRIDMLEMADKPEKAEVSCIEIERGGKSYTIDTLKTIVSENPGCEVWLLVGEDMLASLGHWVKADEILTIANVGAFARTSGENRVEELAENLRREMSARVQVVKNDAIEISSTQLRKALCERGGREYLDEKVYAYIIKNHLYGAKPDFEWLREKAYTMLAPKRISHVAGCEKEAVRLAQRWGEDEDEARTAGILHDITKKENLEEQLILCEKYGIIIDKFEKTEVKLLHSKTGAAIARTEFGVSDAVYSAIFWHTTGKANMSRLEKILYLADYIEETRDFEGLDLLRKLAYEDIDAALMLGLQMSLEDMRCSGIVPHYRSQEAITYLIKQKGRK